MTAALIAVFFFNLFLLITVPLFFLGSGFSAFPLFSYGIKTVSEFLLIYQTAHLVSERDIMLYFPIAALFHIPYLVLFGIWGTFGKVQWKN